MQVLEWMHGVYRTDVNGVHVDPEWMQMPEWMEVLERMEWMQIPRWIRRGVDPPHAKPDPHLPMH